MKLVSGRFSGSPPTSTVACKGLVTNHLHRPVSAPHPSTPSAFVPRTSKPSPPSSRRPRAHAQSDISVVAVLSLLPLSFRSRRGRRQERDICERASERDLRARGFLEVPVLLRVARSRLSSILSSAALVALGFSRLCWRFSRGRRPSPSPSPSPVSRSFCFVTSRGDKRRQQGTREPKYRGPQRFYWR